MAIWAAAILLIAAVGLFIAAPLTERVPGRRGSTLTTESEQRVHEYALALQALRDLEFDYAMNKVDASDYHALRERLERRALVAMAARVPVRRSAADGVAWSGAQPPSDAAAEAVTVKFCPRCGTRISLAHSFCANCGLALVLAKPDIR